MKPDRRDIFVVADWQGLDGPVPVGVVTATPSRGREVFSFAYDDHWLKARAWPTLDPALTLHRGAQFVVGDRANFGVFQDSSPDRWGRVLLRRREAWRARREGRRPRALVESDFLLGVFDGHRMGGLRYRLSPEGPFLDDDAALASPPWTSLAELAHASRELERDDVEDDPRFANWLQMVLAPGRSLGGARPKASVVDSDGALWMAKFPSRDDPHDVGAWEYVVHTLAARAGIDCAEARCQRLGSRHHTFLTRRFDRVGGRRRHFISAMTLLEREDGASDASYLEIVEAIAQHAANAPRDLEQLWRRIAFSMCVSNIDDHLRNHGFLLDATGWTLAPAYDLNPVPTGDGLSLNVSEDDNAQELDLLREVAPWFRLTPSRGEVVLEQVLAAVRSWRSVAVTVGLSRAAQTTMAPAFRIAS